MESRRCVQNPNAETFRLFVQAVDCFYAVYGSWCSGSLSLGVLISPFSMPLIRSAKKNACDSFNTERRQFKEQFNVVIRKFASNLGHPFAYPTDAASIPRYDYGKKSGKIGGKI